MRVEGLRAEGCTINLRGDFGVRLIGEVEGEGEVRLRLR